MKLYKIIINSIILLLIYIFPYFSYAISLVDDFDTLENKNYVIYQGFCAAPKDFLQNIGWASPPVYTVAQLLEDVDYGSVIYRVNDVNKITLHFYSMLGLIVKEEKDLNINNSRYILGKENVFDKVNTYNLYYSPMSDSIFIKVQDELYNLCKNEYTFDFEFVKSNDIIAQLGDIVRYPISISGSNDGKNYFELDYVISVVDTFSDIAYYECTSTVEGDIKWVKIKIFNYKDSQLCDDDGIVARRKKEKFDPLNLMLARVTFEGENVVLGEDLILKKYIDEIASTTKIISIVEADQQNKEKVKIRKNNRSRKNFLVPARLEVKKLPNKVVERSDDEDASNFRVTDTVEQNSSKGDDSPKKVFKRVRVFKIEELPEVSKKIKSSVGIDPNEGGDGDTDVPHALGKNTGNGGNNNKKNKDDTANKKFIPQKLVGRKRASKGLKIFRLEEESHSCDNYVSSESSFCGQKHFVRDVNDLFSGKAVCNKKSKENKKNKKTKRSIKKSEKSEVSKNKFKKVTGKNEKTKSFKNSSKKVKRFAKVKNSNNDGSKKNSVKKIEANNCHHNEGKLSLVKDAKFKFNEGKFNGLFLGKSYLAMIVFLFVYLISFKYVNWVKDVLKKYIIKQSNRKL